MSRKQRDLAAWAFLLVAFVIFAHVIAALGAEAACIWFGHEQILEGKFKCDADNRMVEILNAALASALAFAGLYASRKDGDEKD